MFSYFLDKGLCVIPLRKGLPQIEWSRFYEALPSDDEALGWEQAGHKEYALLCGKVSGVVALDIDTDDTDRFYSLAGPSPLRKRGSKGFTAFYRYNGEKSQSWGGVCEILSDKRLTTIPPSPHRKTGIPYVWMDGDSFDDLPTINPDFFVFMDAKYPKPGLNKAWVERKSYDESVELGEVREMLDYISSDCPRAQWVEIGMALRDEFGDAACSLWHEWSRKAGSRYNHNDAQNAWRSFGGAGVTIGTIIYYARNGGYVSHRAKQQSFSVSIEHMNAHAPKGNAPQSTVLKVGGLVGAVADWITDTAIMPQPALSLSAAIALMGMVKGGKVAHRIRSARTNMLCISMAPTGSGKDWPQQAIDRLAVEIGMDSNLMAKPTSGTALLRGIQKGGGVSLLKIDEIGRFMAHVNNKNASSFQAEIADYIIELYSSATRTFRGRQYADDEKNPPIIIKNPHLCCVGSSVPEKFKESCQATAVIDGFLNRWIMFSSNVWPEKNLMADTSLKYSLIDDIKYWMAQINPEPTYSVANPDAPEPRKIEFSRSAYDIFKDYENKQFELLKATPHPLNSMYARTAEHVLKLSLVLCDEAIISDTEVLTAITIVNQSTASIVAFADTLTDSEHERDVMYVLDVIRNHGVISKSELTLRTRKLTKRKRDEILDQLIEGHQVNPLPGGNGKTTFTAAK